MAAAIVLCFTGLLRVSEALAVTWKDIVFLDQRVILMLGRTKRGFEEKVMFTHPHTVAWLHSYKSKHGRSSGHSICGISYAKFRYWLAA